MLPCMSGPWQCLQPPPLLTAFVARQVSLTVSVNKAPQGQLFLKTNFFNDTDQWTKLIK